MKKKCGFSIAFLFAFVSQAQNTLVNREVKQDEKQLEISYSFLTDTLKGFFMIEETIQGDVKLVSQKTKTPFKFKDGKLQLSGTSVKANETMKFVFTGRGTVSLNGTARFENYPREIISIELEKREYKLEKEELLVVEQSKKEEKHVEKNEEVKMPEIKAVKNEQTFAAVETAPVKPGITYRVQLAASTGKMDVARLKSLTGLNYSVREDLIDNFYKYTIGDEPSLAQAQNILDKLAVNNFKKPFIVAYEDGKRISMAQARMK